MIEFGKEYTYKEICNELNWTETSGCSRQAQIKEIESSFTFYHPENQKTHKPKKSYIFTGQIKEPVAPSVKNNKGGNNTKNVTTMLSYIMKFLPVTGLNQWESYSKWLCHYLCLLDFDTYNAPYSYNQEVEDFCKDKGISRKYVLIKYVAYTRVVMNEMLKNTLDYAHRIGECDYEIGYTFTLESGRRVSTAKLNDFIEEIETGICDDLNTEFELGSFKGRQNKLRIFQKAEWKQEFVGRVVDALNADPAALQILDDEAAAMQTLNDAAGPRIRVGNNNRITGYYAAIQITRLRRLLDDHVPDAREITEVVCEKVRKKMYDTHFTSRNDGAVIHPFNEYDERDITIVENLLFQYSYNKTVIKPQYLDLIPHSHHKKVSEMSYHCYHHSYDFNDFDLERVRREHADAVLTAEEEALFAVDDDIDSGTGQENDEQESTEKKEYISDQDFIREVIAGARFPRGFNRLAS
ncbi:MAG: hypothetical protein LUD12_16055 [Lachnospiraceae bacterium]|nr:hypothetical protein [Lachnospiraceae bacterium]